MSTRRWRSAARGAMLAAVLSLTVAVPLFAGGAATLKEIVYVSDTTNKRVLVLEVTWKGVRAAKSKLVQVIPGFDSPGDLAVADGVAVVVDGKVLRVIDTATHEIIDRIKTGKNTRNVAITPDGAHAVVSQGKAKVKVVDLETGKIAKKVISRRLPGRVRISQDGRFVVVANIATSTLTVIDLPSLLGKVGTTAAARGARFVDGVRQIKAGVCDLSGGLDVAAFDGEGVFAMWSCLTTTAQGRSAGALAAADFQEVEISDDTRDTISTTNIPSLSGVGDTNYNEDCSVKRAGFAAHPENGIIGTDDPELESPKAQIGERVDRTFFWNKFTDKKTFLSDGKMISHFASTDGNRVWIFHPRGVDQGRVGSYVSDSDDTEIGGVGSSISGTRFVCAD